MNRSTSRLCLCILGIVCMVFHQDYIHAQKKWKKLEKEGWIPFDKSLSIKDLILQEQALVNDSTAFFEIHVSDKNLQNCLTKSKAEAYACFTQQIALCISGNVKAHGTWGSTAQEAQSNIETAFRLHSNTSVRKEFEESYTLYRNIGGRYEVLKSFHYDLNHILELLMQNLKKSN